MLTKRSDLPLTWEQVAAFRLERHHLLDRAPRRDLLTVVRDMTGAQAQLPSAAHLSLWTRLRDLQPAHIERALRKRTLVKAACMRRTLFLVPSRDLAVFVRGSARRAEKEIRWTQRKGVPGLVVERAIEATLNLLDEPLTRTEIAERVSRTLGVLRQEVHGGGWGSRRKIAAVPVGHLVFPVVDLLHLVAARGVVCYGPYRGSEPTFVRAEAWVPHWKDLPPGQAEDVLLRLYLRAFSPATAEDFSLWSGMTLREAREIWQRRQADLASVDVQGWKAEVLQEDLDRLDGPRLEQPVIRLLPYFDTYLLGHRGRDHLASAQHRPFIYRPQGWISPVVLVDGRAVATWEQARQGGRLLVQVKKFGPLSSQVRAGIRAEARELGRFLEEPQVKVEVV